MDDRRAQFLTRLVETFRVEAVEHIEAMTAGLVALERDEDVDRAAVIERVFRDAHSLKGAARAVSFSRAEMLCAELEAVFSAVKRDVLALTPEVLDSAHAGLVALEAACADPRAVPTVLQVEREEAALRVIRQLTANDAPPVPKARPKISLPRPAAPAAPPVVPPVVPPADAGPEHTAAPPATSGAESVRVPITKLMVLMQEAELLIGARINAATRAEALRHLSREVSARNRLRARHARSGVLTGVGPGVAGAARDAEAASERSLDQALRDLARTAQQDAVSLAAIADRLLDNAKNTLMLPCSHLLGGLAGTVRETARAQGKDADLRVSGEDIEIDRRVLDELKSPLIHLLRNSVDHGVEMPATRRALGKLARATITVGVRQLGRNQVEISVADDGSGIDVPSVVDAALKMGVLSPADATDLTDADAAALIYHSGLSTSPIVTDLSGRGLGMAIVREKVENLGGSVSVTSIRGAGSAFSIVVPLTIATFRGVHVEAAGHEFVLPSANVVRVFRMRPDDITSVEGRPTVVSDAHPVALVRLRDVLGLPDGTARAAQKAQPVVVLRASDRTLAVIVDDVTAEREVLFKHLGPQLRSVPPFTGATVSASGAVIPILGVADLIAIAAQGSSSAARWTSTPVRRPRALVVDDSITSRTLLKGILEAAGLAVTTSVDGSDALAMLDEFEFDIVISDVDMPQMTGLDLTAAIRADQRIADMPVVLVTSLATRQDRERGVDVGANAYVVKSEFDSDNLIDIVRRFV